MNGLGILEEQVMVLRGACLSRSCEMVEEKGGDKMRGNESEWTKRGEERM